MKAPAVAGGAKVDLAGIIEGVVQSLQPLAIESGVVIENRISGSIEVPGERDELFQVFENLVENACKYGQGGGRVILSAARPAAAGEVGVEVRDFGPGIAEQHIPRITERFYRVDVANSRSQKGTGLGLSIVKHIVTRHRGRLTIGSKIGEGSVFTVYLPKE
jgi:two-component system phosphate regulon sensor histidine kinase PhoR